MNNISLMGRITRDPQVKAYGENNDKKMARFTVACDRRMRREEGQQTADFIPCICYGKTADFADSYLRQGTKIAVVGRLTSGSYTNSEGQKVYTLDVMVDNIEFAESKKANQDSTPSPAPASAPAPTATAQADTNFMDVPDGIEEQLPWS